MINELVNAEEKAKALFKEAEKRNYFVSGQYESELNKKLFDLAEELYGITKYWHKRIIRAGANTLLPYRENPPDLIIQDDDIMFFDFGPIFENWEADFGRTFVNGNDPYKLKLKEDIEEAFYIGKNYFHENYNSLTCSEFYQFTKDLAVKMGWEYGNAHCGHLVGNFPHEKILGDEINNYFHPDNHIKVSDPDALGNQRYWIYEVHFVDYKKQIGGFFEQLVSTI